MSDKKQTLDEWLSSPGWVHCIEPEDLREAAARAFEEAAAEVEESARRRVDRFGEQVALTAVHDRLIARAAELRKGEG